MSNREMKRSSADKEPDVEQLFHAIARRDPSKRQIKPVATTAPLELFDDLDDDSDSEFVCEDQEDEDTEQEDSDSADSSSSDESDSSSSNEDVIQATMMESTVVSEKPPDQGENVATISDKELEQSRNLPEDDQSTLAPESEDAKVANNVCLQPTVGNVAALQEKKPANFLVCMVCLGDGNDPNDELIECDGCGIVVHEDCYKVVDSIFMSSGASSSSTDAWFCEPCLAGVKNPYCELCPNTFGAFKRTDNNRWVHLVCALYTPGIAFNDPDDLMDVTLTELPPKSWASRECSLCEERFFAWTGVCIGCDAGLCRTYFHSTCAQKHGLLSEPVMDENTADPFFAHCRQHTDKVVARQRRRNYLAAMSRWRWKRNQISEAAASMSPGLLNSPDLRHSLTSTNETMAQLEPRVQRKLDQFRSLYEELLKVRDKPYVPTTKTPLLLEHSPLAMRLFVLKAKRLQLPLELTGQSAINDSSKAPPSGYPIFSPDFISYFFEREKRIAEVMKRISALQDTQRELQISDASASHSYNSISSQLENLVTRRNTLRSQFRRIMSSLQQLVPEIKPSPLLESVFEESAVSAEVKAEAEHSSFEVQSRNGPRFGRVSIGRRAVHATDSTTPGVYRGIKRRGTTLSPTSNKHGLFVDKERVLSRASGAGTDSVILECFVCHGLQDQHLITKCDTCSKAFHLACLDPPLLRMPKRSRLYGWQCSFCTKAVASNSEVIQVDVNAPRQLRRSLGGNQSSGVPVDCTDKLEVKVELLSKLQDSKPTEIMEAVTTKPEPLVTESSVSFQEPKTPFRRKAGSIGSSLIKNSRSRTTCSTANAASRGGRSRMKRSLGTPRCSTATGSAATATAATPFKSRRPIHLAAFNVPTQKEFGQRTAVVNTLGSLSVGMHKLWTSHLATEKLSDPDTKQGYQIHLVKSFSDKASFDVDSYWKSAPSIFKSRSQESDLPVQPTILITQIDSNQCETTKVPESTTITSRSFDAYEYHADANSDEEITRLRSSKVIKFEQIRDHSRNNDSESVEQIAPLNLRYIICRDNGGAYQKKSAPERFRVKLKKL
ncbi:PHD finger protein 14 [Clonorchis sinensis]|uniref:PHD finger protein 14 n=1 Tax=Clonorchis sinensis TaxID=79923 RepID=H2KRH4_CLOSI|nr:PHD finger protein 14 [Clonorchis sinensis]